MITIANVFPKLQTVKDLVRKLSRKLRFRTTFDSQHVKGFQKLVKSSSGDFYHIFSLLWDTLIWKMSLLVICKSKRCFLTHWLTMTSITFGNERNCGSQSKCNCLRNEKSFFQFFVLFMESTSNFTDFEKKYDRHS